MRIESGLPSFGEEWEWAARMAPGFDIENRPLSEFLAWLVREHGWQLRFTDAQWQSRAQGIRLHGSSGVYRYLSALKLRDQLIKRILKMLIQHKTKASLFLVVAQQDYGSHEIRILKERFRY